MNENINPGRFIEVIDAIHDQGGISILPHPFKNTLADPVDLIRHVDMLEVLNARISKKLNYKASVLSKKIGTGIVAGSDAHTSFEIGRVLSIITGEETVSDSDDIKKYLQNGNINIWGNESPFHIRMLSTGIGKYKKAGITGLIKAGLHKVSLR